MTTTIIRRPVSSELSQAKHLHPLLRRIYAARGIVSPSELEHALENLLPYHTLKNIDKAAAYLAQALIEQQRILIIGDFDADGATSTALAISALRCFGAQQVDYLVPNRFTYGYGLTPEIVAVAAERQPNWIITVDNGISSIEGVAAAKASGIKILITDHHLPGAELPAADVIINPNQLDDKFPSKNLAGVGVIFYVMLALRSHLRTIGWFKQQGIAESNMAQFLDLVALGTVADVVPLDQNNRILVQQGLRYLRAGKMRPGIQALLEVAGRNPLHLVASDLGFAIAPRLNAAGRLEDMALGIECLLSDDSNKAKAMALQLDALNRERQVIEADMQQQAQAALAKLNWQNELPLGLCLYDPDWHQGVVGILAGRIKEKLHRPIIVFAKANDMELKGSARSVPGLHIRDVLDRVATRYPAIMQRFGGHAAAAGLTLRHEHYPQFCRAFDEEVRKLLRDEDLQDKIYSDGELATTEFSMETARMLREANPWGQGFPEPLFDGVFELVQQRLVGQHHLKMTLQIDGTKQQIEAIAFNINNEIWPNYRCRTIKTAYRLDINEFRGLQKIQLIIEHLEPLE
ncbi:MAG: single-stranded-DNA-specific exonuclease RecJ [Gammaproteobacteria bacterium]